MKIISDDNNTKKKTPGPDLITEKILEDLSAKCYKLIT